jgi:hypothetical protein
MKSALLALGITLWAPYQCGTEPNDRPREDSAPQALWMLAEKFEQEGNAGARETTLRQLVEVYPSSRYAERARHDLGLPGKAERGAQSGEQAASTGDEDPEHGDD